jgi:gluconolactonase
MRRLHAIVLALFSAGCLGSADGADGGGGDMAVVNQDLAGADLAGADLAGLDFANPTPDLAPYPDPIPDGAAVTEIVPPPDGGYQFLEGPLWRASGVLLFSDIPPNRIYQLNPPSTITIFRSASGAANGHAVDPQGLLVTCEGGNKRVTRTLANGTVMPVATLYNGATFNSPNDVIVHSNGTIYFTDPNYSSNPDTQAGEYVFRVTTAGTVFTVDTTRTRPNGIALAPDEKTLYVADEPNQLIQKYSVDNNGVTGSGTKFADTTGNPDGIAVDDAGNLYATVNAGVEVFRPNGTRIGLIPVPKQPANCGFGGVDRRTLYITARTSLYRVVLNVPGPP